MAGKWPSFGGLNVNSNEDAEHTLKRLRRLQWITMIVLWIVIAMIFYNLYGYLSRKSDAMISRENPLKGTFMVDGKDVLTEEYLKEDYKSYFYWDDYGAKSASMALYAFDAAFVVYIISAALGSIVRARVLGKPLDKEKLSTSLRWLIAGAITVLALATFIANLVRLYDPSPKKANLKVYEIEYQGKRIAGSGSDKSYMISYVENGEIKEKVVVGDFTYAMYPDDACTLYVATFHGKNGDQEFYTYRADEYTLP